MKRSLNSFFLTFCIAFSFAQIDVKFIDHLATNNLINEHTSYLNSLTTISDSVYYFKAKFNLKYANDSGFMDNYAKSKLLCQKDTLLINQASAYFLNNNNKLVIQTWFNGLNENTNTGCLGLTMAYKASLDPNLYTKETFPFELQRSYLKYKRVYNKKPVAAAFFSAIIPGSGKLYAGKTKTFFLTFLLNAAYAAQTMESTKKLGIKNPLSIINATAFTVFYLSNIYGSYKAVIDLRKERKKQFITDATNFYN
ncbi:MAG: hypothetical protein H0U95_01390 [Bacteroidetes bacterium]|nr:hypothetical protein [Bacteroidota bacterium]